MSHNLGSDVTEHVLRQQHATGGLLRRMHQGFCQSFTTLLANTYKHEDLLVAASQQGSYFGKVPTNPDNTLDFNLTFAYVCFRARAWHR